MNTTTHVIVRLGLILVTAGSLLLVSPGCSKQARIERRLSQADSHFSAGNYDRAEIEYKNALQLDPQNWRAMGRLGRIFYEQGRVLPARALLARAAELAPDDVGIRLSLGQTDAAVRNFPSAYETAAQVLAREPANPDAPRLLVESAINLGKVDDALATLTNLPASARDTTPVQVAMSLLALAQNRFDDAQAAADRALALDPKSAEVHSARAALHGARNEPVQMEAELKRAAELAPPRSPRRLAYAQFKLQTGDVAGARQLLTKMNETTPDFLPAWIVRAQIEGADRNIDQALELVNRVLGRDPLHPDGVLLAARLQLAKGEFAAAVTALERVNNALPGSPQFLHQLGVAYAASGETRKALDSLNQALVIAPDFPDAAILRASLLLRTGDVAAAIASLRTTIEKFPQLIQPRLLLAEAHRTGRNPADALTVYEAIDRDFPNNPRTPMLKGLVLLQLGRRADARGAFEEATKRDDDFLPAIEQLVSLDLAERRFDAAQQRIETLRGRFPESPEPLLLQARLHSAQQQTDEAEAVLKKAIDLRPEAPAAYFMLASLYLANNRQEGALANLDQVLKQNPRDLRALTLTGMLYEQLQRHDEAVTIYERILTVDPNSGVALNNLAVLYAERYNKLDRAFEAAQKVRALYPNDPRLADTLGWILVQRRQYPYALSLLRESADKMPTNAEVQYHLGVAHYFLGEEAPARAAFETALQLSSTFPGVADARKRLAVLAIDPATADAGARRALESALAEQPEDPVALVRQAALLERQGNRAKAFSTYQAALKASPANVPVMLNLVRLHVAQGEPQPAMELARSARKLAPDDAEVARVLGDLAFQSRDYSWSYSLLQEATRRDPGHLGGLRRFARAAYSVGRVDDAKRSLQRVLEVDAFASEAAADRELLELINLAEDPARARESQARVAQALRADPGSVPALMAAAAADEAGRDLRSAITRYEKVLERYPDFTPAMRKLAIHYTALETESRRALELALKARAAAPADPEVGKALGIIHYRQGDFARALPVLRESAGRAAGDAELSFYLGMTHAKLKDTGAAKAALQRALELNLGGNLAATARQALTEMN